MSFQKALNILTVRIKSLRSHPSDYPELLWAILVFVGGAISALAMKLYADWFLWAERYSQRTYHTTNILNVPSAYFAIILYGVIVFVAPLIFSILFTRVHPEKRLVPPIYMQIVSIGFLIAVAFPYNSIPADYIMFFGSLSFGIIQDTIVVSGFGKTVTKDNIIRYSFRTITDIETIKSLVMTEQFQRVRGLRIIKGKSGEPLRLKTAPIWGKNRSVGYQFVLELKEGNEPEEKTIINIIAYDESSYFIKPIKEGDDVHLITQSKIAALRDYFESQQVWLAEIPTSHADLLVSWMLQDLEGTFTRIQEASTLKKAVIISAIISFAVGLGLIAVGRIDTGIAALAIAAFLVVDGVFRE